MTIPQKITVTTAISASLDKVWKCWTEPRHIMQWNHASDDWHCPAASNDLRVGGMLKATMAARDGSMSFDFGGIYSAVVPNQKIAFTMGDGRNVEVVFSGQDDKVQVTETFDAESTHSIEMQRTGWQAILDNFKTYCEKV